MLCKVFLTRPSAGCLSAGCLSVDCLSADHLLGVIVSEDCPSADCRTTKTSTGDRDRQLTGCLRCVMWSERVWLHVRHGS